MGDKYYQMLPILAILIKAKIMNPDMAKLRIEKINEVIARPFPFSLAANTIIESTNVIKGDRINKIKRNV